MKILYTVVTAVLLSACLGNVHAAHKSDTLRYAPAEAAGIDGEYMSAIIDSLVQQGLDNYAFPGCQVLVARKGVIVHHKSYGHHTYRRLRPVENDHIFDLASCSKVMGATIALMKLVEDGKLDLDKPFSDVFPYFKGSNKEGITLREFLAHQGGLQPSVGWGGIIFDENRNLRKDLFSYSQSEEYPIEVYSNMWGRKDLPEIVYQAVADTKLREKKYRYSCMSFLCYPYVIKQITGKEYEDFLRDEFYIPLGADAIMLNPTHRYPRKKIMPTEVDETFRNSMVRGYVHDESAALLGGISGNAGVFSNAESMAKILQMLLNGGTYNGKRYLKKKTIQEWTSCQYPENDNRRGLGFDRPYFDSNPDDSYPINEVSDKSWGHTGFTGTMFWADPEQDLIFIFLSNSVYPYRGTSTMGRLSTRSKCQEAVYEAIRRHESKQK